VDPVVDLDGDPVEALVEALDGDLVEDLDGAPVGDPVGGFWRRAAG
jgi:hypothetical protein